MKTVRCSLSEQKRCYNHVSAKITAKLTLTRKKKESERGYISLPCSPVSGDLAVVHDLGSWESVIMRRPSMGHQSTRRERGFKRRVKRQLPSITGHYQTRGSPGTMGVLLRGNYTPASHQTQAHRDLMLTTQKSTDILPQSHHWTSTYIYTGFLIRKLHTGNYSASQSLPWKTLL